MSADAGVRTVAEDYDVQIVTRGEVSPRDRDEAVDRIGRLGRLIRDPILFARVKLNQVANPARERPAIAQGSLDVNGRVVRAHTAEETMHAAIEALEARLRDKLEHLSERRAAVRKRGPEPREPNAWRRGDPATPRPPWFDRPAEEREIVRRKTFALRPMSPEQAADEMELLDFDFHLFTDEGSGQDAVVFRRPEGGVGLLSLDGDLAPFTDDVTAEPAAAPEHSFEEAVGRLGLTGDGFVFFRDAVSGRGTVLYRRYDGHYGAISPAVSD